jgi:hypothetical protein
MNAFVSDDPNSKYNNETIYNKYDTAENDNGFKNNYLELFFRTR